MRAKVLRRPDAPPVRANFGGRSGGEPVRCNACAPERRLPNGRTPDGRLSLGVQDCRLPLARLSPTANKTAPRRRPSARDGVAMENVDAPCVNASSGVP